MGGGQRELGRKPHCSGVYDYTKAGGRGVCGRDDLRDLEETDHLRMRPIHSTCGVFPTPYREGPRSRARRARLFPRFLACHLAGEPPCRRLQCARRPEPCVSSAPGVGPHQPWPTPAGPPTSSPFSLSPRASASGHPTSFPVVLALPMTLLAGTHAALFLFPVPRLSPSSPSPSLLGCPSRAPFPCRALLSLHPLTSAPCPLTLPAHAPRAIQSPAPSPPRSRPRQIASNRFLVRTYRHTLSRFIAAPLPANQSAPTPATYRALAHVSVSPLPSVVTTLCFRPPGPASYLVPCPPRPSLSTGTPVSNTARC